MKRIFCLLFLILIFLCAPKNSALSEEIEAYNSDVIYLDTAKYLKLALGEVEVEKTENAEKTKELQDMENTLPENSFEGSDEEEQEKKEYTGKFQERPLLKKMIEKGIIRTDIPSYFSSTTTPIS